METILVPLDGSPLAREALPMATTLAGLFNTQLVLLNVTPPLGNNPDADRQRQRDAKAQAQLSADIEPYMPFLKQHQVEVRPLLTDGSVAEGIVTTAQRLEADVIVMTTHGYTGLKRWALGSITDKVAQTMHTPLLVVRGTETPDTEQVTLKRILITLDGSDLARQSLPLATSIAAKAGAELVLLRVIASHLSDAMRDLSEPRLNSAELADMKSTLMHEVEPYAELLQANNVTVTPVVVEGSVAETISIVARQHEVDLIVMSTHGYNAAFRWALGSIANKVLQASDIPLLLRRPRPAAATP